MHAGQMAKDFPDGDFLPIYTGMRTLRPACDLIVSTVAAYDMHRREDMERAVVELVKDTCRKLNNTNNKGKMIVPNPTIPPEQVVVHASLLPPRASNQWGAATTIGNPGQLPPNPPPAHVPKGGEIEQAPPQGAAVLNVPPAQVNVTATRQHRQAPPGTAVPTVLAAEVNIIATGQHGQAPPGAAVPNVSTAHVNVPAAGQLGQAPLGDFPAVGPDVAVQPGKDPVHQQIVRDSSLAGNDPAHRQIVRDSCSPDNDPAPGQMGPDPTHNSPGAVQHQPVARGFRPAPNCRCNRYRYYGY